MAALNATAAAHPDDPGFALVRGSDQWARASYEDTALLDGSVQLAWETLADPGETPADPPARGAGLAFDGHCWLYRSRPEDGSVERMLWAASDPLTPTRPGPAPTPLFAAPSAPLGDFAPAHPTLPLANPRGLATDADQRLFVALAGARSVLVLDLWGGRVLRRAAFPGRPLDLATDPASGDRELLVLTESPVGLYRMTARGRPRRLELPDGVEAPGRIACTPDGGRYLLCAAATAGARLLELTPPYRGPVAVPWATDLACTLASGEPPGAALAPVLVIARRPGEPFLRLQPAAAGFEWLPGLLARGYDGLGIALAPDGRIVYWTAKGLRCALAGRTRYRASGRTIGFRLDSGDFQTPWGRLFIDACVPRETQVRVHCIVADEAGSDLPRLPRQPPVNAPQSSPRHDELSPPLPPLAWLPAPEAAADPLYRRDQGPELPWVRRAPSDPFATYETPVGDTRGRYLWVVLELAGNGRNTPRVRSLRAEYPGHDLVSRLPLVLSREPEAERFLARFLAPLAGLVGDLDARARLRQVLLDPVSTPEEALPWLAGFFGLVLDERWPSAVRRQLIAKVVELFRYRGTIRGLTCFLGIVAGVKPIFVERYRTRGGATIGEPTAHSSRSVLGAGMRVGGRVGSAGATPLGPQSVADAFDTHAHRFTVMLPALLSQDDLDLAAHILDVHRPAHTLYDLCTVTAGSRVGRGLHVGLSSVVGRGSGWEPIQLGASALGRGSVLGRPGPGTRTDGARVGLETRVG